MRWGLRKACQCAAVAVASLLILPAESSGQTQNQSQRPSSSQGHSYSKDSFQPLQQTIKVLSTNLEGFGIPFKVANQNGKFIEVQLYLSTDKGKTWSFHSRQPTSAREFPFTSDGDGEYWFAIKTLDRDRRLLPDGNARAELKIIVDTQKPKLAFQIESDAAGRVVCRWQAFDESLDATSLQIEYRASAGDFQGEEIDETWKSVPVQLDQKVQSQTWTDQIAWWPDTSNSQLEVRMRIADLAGNENTASRYVAVKRASWRTRSTGSTINQARPTANASQQARNFSNDSAAWRPKLKPLSNTTQSVAKNTAQSGHSNMILTNNSKSDQPSPATERTADRWRINETQTQTDGQTERQTDEQQEERLAWNPVAIRVASNQLPPGVELVDPPEPLNWNLPAAPQPMPNQSKGSVAWESEIQSQQSSDRSFVGSTMPPTPDIAPLLTEQPPRITDSIASNPATTVRSGKNVISESTTSWPNNQWKGPTTAKVQPNSALTPRTNQLVKIKRPEQNSPRPDSFTEKSRFSNAGFRQPQAESNPIIERSNDLPNPASHPMPQSASMPKSANTQIIGTKRFNLNYDINAIDPSGVGQIDLWMTRDRGQTWKLWGQDPDSVSPFPVEVAEEGIYGFRIVVRSKDGLAGRGPMRGEEADMWVQVDVTAPLVKITSVPYGRGSEAGKLVINYAASDSNLVLRPNRLLWSTNPDGPWTTIEENLRNESRLVWKPSQNVPKQIFIRLESADRAGNVGIHNLEQPIDLSGLIPRGTIFGVVPVGE